MPGINIQTVGIFNKKIALPSVQAFIDRFRYNANRAALVQSRIKALERLAGAFFSLLLSLCGKHVDGAGDLHNGHWDDGKTL